ncbi:hypothetical protein [Paenibacillus athensensis]|nr:hypothetical protein [Paenibacillus athensensis]
MHTEVQRTRRSVRLEDALPAALEQSKPTDVVRAAGSGSQGE